MLDFAMVLYSCEGGAGANSEKFTALCCCDGDGWGAQAGWWMGRLELAAEGEVNKDKGQADTLTRRPPLATRQLVYLLFRGEGEVEGESGGGAIGR